MTLSSLLLTVFGVSVSATIHTIQVGQSGLVFSPQTTSAQPGDHVVFELHPSHDVASSNFSEPCQPNKVYYSGDYDMSSKGKKKFVINITNDDPIYFYCSVNKHCQNGMVGGINTPSSGDTIEAYASQAALMVANYSPAERETGGVLLTQEEIDSLEGDSVSQSNGSTSSATGSRATTAGSSTTPAGTSGNAQATSSSAGAIQLLELGPSGKIVGLLGFIAWIF